jgi:hypothetical protein
MAGGTDPRVISRNALLSLPPSSRRRHPLPVRQQITPMDNCCVTPRTWGFQSPNPKEHHPPPPFPRGRGFNLWPSAVSLSGPADRTSAHRSGARNRFSSAHLRCGHPYAAERPWRQLTCIRRRCQATALLQPWGGILPAGGLGGGACCHGQTHRPRSRTALSWPQGRQNTDVLAVSALAPVVPQHSSLLTP